MQQQPFPSKGRHAVNALVDLALRAADGPVALVTVSRRLQVSLSYLEQLFSRLRRHGLVESTRGPGGGYTLAQAADRISVADIVTAVDGDVATAVDADAEPDLTHAMWLRLRATMLDHMATITLQSLVDEQRNGEAAPAAESLPTRRLAAPLLPAARPPARPRAPNSVFAFGQSFAPA